MLANRKVSIFVTYDGLYFLESFDPQSPAYMIASKGEEYFNCGKKQEQLELQLDERRLKLHLSIAENKIKENDVIEIVRRNAEYFPIQIAFKDLPPITANVSNETTIDHLLLLANLKFHIPMSRHREKKLYCENRSLKTRWTVSVANLKKGSLLRLEQGRIVIGICTYHQIQYYRLDGNMFWKTLRSLWCHAMCISDPDDITFKIKGKLINMYQAIGSSGYGGELIEVVYPSYYVELTIRIKSSLHTMSINPKMTCKKLFYWLGSTLQIDINGYTAHHRGAEVRMEEILEDIGIVTNPVIVFESSLMAA